MEILVEPGRLPDRGTLIVPIAIDGTLGRGREPAWIGPAAA